MMTCAFDVVFFFAMWDVEVAPVSGAVGKGLNPE